MSMPNEIIVGMRQFALHQSSMQVQAAIPVFSCDPQQVRVVCITRWEPMKVGIQ